MKSIGKYEIVGTIGAGAMGTVYKGYDRRLARYVAIKALFPQFIDDAEKAARFLKEARALAQIPHPNIVQIHDLYEEDGMPYIVMEYLEGRNLKQLRDAGIRFSLAQTLNILSQVARGLDYAHQNGVVHRDVKPANLIVTRNGSVKIVDFGIARLVESTIHTREGVTVGTLAYMSPEQARGEPVDARADQYSLGVIAYELLQGDNPFQAENATGVLYRILTHNPPLLGNTLSGCPQVLSEAVARMLNKERSNRLANLSDFAGLCEDTRRQEGLTDGGLETIFDAIAPAETAGPEGALRPDDTPWTSAASDTSTLDEETTGRTRAAGFGPPARAGWWQALARRPLYVAPVLAALVLAALAVYPGWAAIGAKLGLAPTAPEYVVPPGVYGGIEVGASGVRAVIARFGEHAEGLGDYQELDRRHITSSMITYSPDAIAESVREIAELYRWVREGHHLPDDRIVIAGSSGVVNAAELKGPWAVARLETLKREVLQTTGCSVQFITAEQEAELGALGILPPRAIYTALALDLGSGNTKGGYLEKSVGGDRFVPMDIPVGSKSLSLEIDRECGPVDHEPACIDRTIQNHILPILAEKIERKPGLLNRRDVYLSGGIVWALVTLTYPERRDPTVSFTAEDIRTFYARIVKDPTAVVGPDLSKIEDEVVQQEALQEILNIRDIFHVKQLVAGGALMVLLADQLEFDRKQLYFIRYANQGWFKGYLARYAARQHAQAATR